MIALGFVALLLPTETLAGECGSQYPEARRPRPDDPYYEYVTSKYGNVCTLADRDHGQWDYYTASETRCKAMPGFLFWNRDRGAGYNLCIFNPPSSGTAEEPTNGGSGGANSCEYANDGTCDEPGLCAPGTDTNDCISAVVAGPDSCKYANDDVCDEPLLCASGTDTSDCRQKSARRDSGNSHFFAFKVCNRSSDPAYVAVGFWDGSDWEVAGWGKVPAHSCKRYGRYRRGWFYYYAESPTGNWSGTAKHLCVRYPGPFERVDRSGYSCHSDENLKGFHGRQVDTATFTWNLNP